MSKFQQIPKTIINRGVSFTGLLTILFVGLKLTKHIDWSWWWVVSPLWLPFAFVAALVLAIGGGWFLMEIISDFKRKRRKKKQEKASVKKRKVHSSHTELLQQKENNSFFA